jgi:methyltransferase (TIGR00027 family)
MSQVFLPWAARPFTIVPLLRWVLRARLTQPGLSDYVLARTRIFDDAFSSALDERFAQVVLLGAGFDTRALRFAGRNQHTQVFELDMPSTQEAKLGVYRRKRVPLPAELTFVPIDFDTQELGEALRTGGYRDGEKTLFLWEGVTMYLTAEAVHATLDFIGRSAGTGSSLVFDYVYADILRGDAPRFAARQAFEAVRKAGEAWTFGVDDGEIEALLVRHGLQLRSHYTPADLERLYFTGPDGTLLRRVNGAHCIAMAGTRRT